MSASNYTPAAFAFPGMALIEYVCDVGLPPSEEWKRSSALTIRCPLFLRALWRALFAAALGETVKVTITLVAPAALTFNAPLPKTARAERQRLLRLAR